MFTKLQAFFIFKTLQLGLQFFKLRFEVVRGSAGDRRCTIQHSRLRSALTSAGVAPYSPLSTLRFPGNGFVAFSHQHVDDRLGPDNLRGGRHQGYVAQVFTDLWYLLKDLSRRSLAFCSRS